MTGKLPKFKPYVVEDSTVTIQEVSELVNDQVYQGYSSDYGYGGRKKIVSGTLFDFERLLQKLTALPHMEFVTHRQLLSEPCPPDRIRVGIRHDKRSPILMSPSGENLWRLYGFGVVSIFLS